MNLFKILIFTTLVMLYSSTVAAFGDLPSHIVAKFPPGVFTVGEQCTDETPQNVLKKCKAALNEGSPEEEKFACSLVEQNNLLLGTYPLQMKLDVFPGRLTTNQLGEIFRPCMLYASIGTGCISFDAGTQYPRFETHSFKSTAEYASVLKNQFGIDTSKKGPFKGLDLGVILKSNTINKHKTSVNLEAAGIIRTWNLDFGTISIDETCALIQISSSYKSSWYNALTDDKNMQDAFTPEFNSLISRGVLFPTKFTYGIQYMTHVHGFYEADSQSITDTMAQAIQAGAKYAKTGLTASIATEITKVAESKGVNILLESSELKSGMCDFSKLFEKDSRGQMIHDYEQVFRECANDSHPTLATLGRPIYIPRGGFSNVFDSFTGSSATLINSPRSNALIKIHKGYCFLGDSTPSNPFTQCYTGDGELAYRNYYRKFEPKSIWKLQDDAYFQMDSVERRKLLDKLCGSCK